MKRNGLDNTNLNWIIPHEANLRIIDAVAKRAELPLDKVVINIPLRQHIVCHNSFGFVGQRGQLQEG